MLDLLFWSCTFFAIAYLFIRDVPSSSSYVAAMFVILAIQEIAPV